MIYIIMGVSGSGKSTLGMFLSEKDRFPWLLKLHEVIQRELRSGSHALVVCSALKRQYRQILLYGSRALSSSSSLDHDVSPPTSPNVYFLFLYGDYDFILQRMVARRGHYMKAEMLRSQFDVLEPPLDEENVLPLDVRRSITDMATEVEKHMISLKASPAMQ
ncbi:probable gluconokinase isoform X2 [Parambassis ranga]|uniref:gluconokinase n=1 Tax=Parambassis ranga TaxID=210632 RepID=A0A6P7J2F5_9TELE|nr:probable gluconokinase isoform X2 [Parambassis ranga]XP_028270978.1 probable gluconokinase isoform X2 [Parambassis ranga]